MRITIDGAGRLVLPKAERERLGLRPGDELELESQADGIRLTPVQGKPRLIKDGAVLVFTGQWLGTGDPVEEARRARIDDLIRRATT